MRNIELKILDTTYQFVIDDYELPFSFSPPSLKAFSTFHNINIVTWMTKVLKQEINCMNKNSQINLSEEETQEMIKLMNIELLKLEI